MTCDGWCEPALERRIEDLCSHGPSPLFVRDDTHSWVSRSQGAQVRTVLCRVCAVWVHAIVSMTEKAGTRSVASY